MGTIMSGVGDVASRAFKPKNEIDETLNMSNLDNEHLAKKFLDIYKSDSYKQNKSFDKEDQMVRVGMLFDQSLQSETGYGSTIIEMFPEIDLFGHRGLQENNIELIENNPTLIKKFFSEPGIKQTLKDLNITIDDVINHYSGIAHDIGMPLLNKLYGKKNVEEYKKIFETKDVENLLDSENVFDGEDINPDAFNVDNEPQEILINENQLQINELREAQRKDFTADREKEIARLENEKNNSQENINKKQELRSNIGQNIDATQETKPTKNEDPNVITKINPTTITSKELTQVNQNDMNNLEVVNKTIGLNPRTKKQETVYNVRFTKTSRETNPRLG